MRDVASPMTRETSNQRGDIKSKGQSAAEPLRGLQRSVFAIALTLLIVEIKVPGFPEGSHGYSDLTHAIAERWRDPALALCYIVIGAYWLQHHYSGRIHSKSDHWFGPSTYCSYWRSSSSLSNPHLVLPPRDGI